MRTTPPPQNTAPSRALHSQQSRWLENFLPALPPLTSDAVAQSGLSIRIQGLRLTTPSDVARPAFLASRLDTARSIARLSPTSPVDATISTCEPLIVSQVAEFRTLLFAPTTKHNQLGSAAAILMTHVHDRRTSEFWPSSDSPLNEITQEDS